MPCEKPPSFAAAGTPLSLVLLGRLAPTSLVPHSEQLCLRLIPTPQTPSSRWGVLKALMGVSGNTPLKDCHLFCALYGSLHVLLTPTSQTLASGNILNCAGISEPLSPNPTLYPHQGGDQDPGAFIWGSRPWKTQFQDDSIRKYLGTSLWAPRPGGQQCWVPREARALVKGQGWEGPRQQHMDPEQ